LTFSSMVSKDIYGNYINPHASEKKKLLVGKWTGVVTVFILLLIAWYPPATLYEIFVLKFEVLIQVAPAFILGLYWKRLSSGPVLTGMIIGAAIAGIMTWTGLKTFLGFYSGIWGLLVNLIICVVGSWIVSASVQERENAEKVLSA
jgi:SSS family solute:Na+ symporter